MIARRHASLFNRNHPFIKTVTGHKIWDYYDQLTVFDQRAKNLLSEFEERAPKKAPPFILNSYETCINMATYGVKHQGRKILRNPWIPILTHQLILLLIVCTFQDGAPVMLTWGIGTFFSLNSKKVKYARLIKMLEKAQKEEEVIRILKK